jgi:hypothetical protein
MVAVVSNTPFWYDFLGCSTWLFNKEHAVNSVAFKTIKKEFGHRETRNNLTHCVCISKFSEETIAPRGICVTIC